MATTTKLETLGEIAARQSVVTDALRALLDEFGPATTAVSYSEVTPWGTYLRDVQVEDRDAIAESLFERMVSDYIDGRPFCIGTALRYCSLTGMEFDYVRADVIEAAADVLDEVTA